MDEIRSKVSELTPAEMEGLSDTFQAIVPLEINPKDCFGARDDIGERLQDFEIDIKIAEGDQSKL